MHGGRRRLFPDPISLVRQNTLRDEKEFPVLPLRIAETEVVWESRGWIKESKLVRPSVRHSRAHMGIGGRGRKEGRKEGRDCAEKEGGSRESRLVCITNRQGRAEGA